MTNVPSRWVARWVYRLIKELIVEVTKAIWDSRPFKPVCPDKKKEEKKDE